MDKHTEIIFNLLIMEYFSFIDRDSPNLEEEYQYTESHYLFRTMKSCFPENEVTYSTVVLKDFKPTYATRIYNMIQE